MIEIIPAILPKSFAGLVRSLERLVDVVRLVQIDVVDGIFVPNKTWPYVESDSFEKIASEKAGLPFWESFDFEFDLMLEHPERDVEKFIHAGAARLVIHVKSIGAKDALEQLQPARQGELGVKVGIALSLDETTEVLTPFEGLYDFVQVMGIEKEGFQGQTFDPRALALVSAVRTVYSALPMQVDGGVKLENVRGLVEAGATRLVVGSAIVIVDDPAQAIQAFRREVGGV